MYRELKKLGFYINYVVCKSGLPPTLDVKTTKFYINYVVCKLVSLSLWNIYIMRFILTMWYVNLL